tara:strand:+ start:1501 stop:1938 length:438 start_codon:yes stop_codon:yes gene_type:complete
MTEQQIPTAGQNFPPEEQVQMKTNHNVRIVNLATGDNVLCIFGELRNEADDNKVVGYKMVYPFKLTLGEVNADNGTIPINYQRWCPFSPIEEHRLGGEHIISVVFPDNNILDNFVNRLKEVGVKEEQIFWEDPQNGNNSEPAEAA